MSQVHDHGSVVDSDVKLLDFFKTSSPEILTVSSSEESEPMVKKKEEEKKAFSCKFCGKKFTNLQALGGHQNAHKYERNKAKKKKDALLNFRPGASADMFGTSEPTGSFYYPYHHHNYHQAMAVALSQCNNALGVKPHSTIRKPNYGPAAHCYQWSLKQQQIAAAQRYSASSSTGSRDGFLHDQMEVIGNGGNSTSNIKTNLSETEGRGGLKLETMENTKSSRVSFHNLDDECNSHGLDLTLKL